MSHAFINTNGDYMLELHDEILIEANPVAELERKRIIALLEPLAQHSELCEGGCYPEDCSAFAYEYAIGLIKGEQSE